MSGVVAARSPKEGARKGRMIWRLGRLVGNSTVAISVLLLALFIVLAIFAPQIAPHDPTSPDLMNRLSPPMGLGGTSANFLGTDHLGRDVLSRLIFGTRIAIFVALIAVGIAGTIGISIGLAAGYFGGWVDALSMRVVDTLISIPNILLYLTVLGIFGPSLITLVLVIGFINWTTFARVVRAEVLSIKEREFVEASRAIGQRSVRIIATQLLPNILAPIIVLATIDVAKVIILESSLSFLGLGVQPPTVTWGRMLADGRDYITSAWWLATLPGICITLLCLSLIFIGDRLRDLLDPRTRDR